MKDRGHFWWDAIPALTLDELSSAVVVVFAQLSLLLLIRLIVLVLIKWRKSHAAGALESGGCYINILPRLDRS